MKPSVVVCFAVLLGLGATTCYAQSLPTGTFKVVAFTLEIDGATTTPYGKSPRGVVVLTPDRFIGIVTAENRKFGTSLAEKAALWESMVAYSGKYAVGGNEIHITVDVSYNEAWNGTQLVRFWQFSGNQLTLTSPPAPWSRDPTKTVSAKVIFERSE
jgi:hypothetical protein